MKYNIRYCCLPVFWEFNKLRMKNHLVMREVSLRGWDKHMKPVNAEI